MTYKIWFSAHINKGGGYLFDPTALVKADSITEAEKKFLEYAEKHFEKYDIEVFKIEKSSMDLVP